MKTSGMKTSYYFASESVSEGHPDKLCDRVSDAILDHFMASDSNTRAGIECLATTNLMVIAGEIKTKADSTVETIEKVARNVIRDIGYVQEYFNWNTVRIENYIHAQSEDIAMGVDVDRKKGKKMGAGDQGTMFGFATDETPTLMPSPIYYCHKILKQLAKYRKSPQNIGLEPDMKDQIVFKYDDNDNPIGIENILVSSQHIKDIDPLKMRNVIKDIVFSIIPSKWHVHDDNFFVNPTGRFVIGGPHADVGLTGRKIIVDTYGGQAPHGGGAFSGKDPSKVDRSAAYMARWLAKNVVASGIAKKCLIQLSYAIGIANPLSIYVHTYGTGKKVSDKKISLAIQSNLDLSPEGMIKSLKLDNDIYFPTSAYGHFGRHNKGKFFTWEKLNIVDIFKDLK